MIGRIVVVLLCLGLAIAPAAAADSGGEGTCVWTSREGTDVRAGANLHECTSTGGTWVPARG